MQIIGIDTGKFETKVVSAEKRFVIRSKVDLTNENAGAYVLSHQGQHYLIGEEAREEDYDLTKEKKHHKLLMWLGLSQVSHQVPITIVLGCPWSIYLNRQKREQYQDFMFDRFVTFQLNQEGVSLEITDLRVVPENIGHLYLRPSYFKNRLTGIIDIGGLNTNAAIYEGLKPLRETAFTLNEGGYILDNKIRNQLKSQFGLNFQDYEIQHLIERGVHIEGASVPEGDQLIQEIMHQHIEKLIAELKKNNWNLSGLDLIFTGRGSIRLSAAIKHLLPHAVISANSRWDNADGFYAMGKIIYAN